MGDPEPSGTTRAAAATSALEWNGDEECSFDGVAYHCRPRFDTFPSSANRFCIRKPREVIERYEELIRRLAPQRIAEVGIYEGGSTALLAQLARPQHLVAFDIEENPNPALGEFAAERGYSDTLDVHWGVDQADGARLNAILDEALDDRSLDLVIDDASHLLEESRATFDALFPRLRPGGEYVLEDWAWAHAMIEVWPNKQPLTVLVAEASIACAYHPHVIAAVDIDRPWAIIRRGEAELDPTSFSLRDSLGARGEALIDGMRSGGLVERAKPRGGWRRLWR